MNTKNLNKCTNDIRFRRHRVCSFYLTGCRICNLLRLRGCEVEGNSIFMYWANKYFYFLFVYFGTP